MSVKTRRLAVLYDLENMQKMPLVERAMAAAAKYGIITVRRAYGSWDNPELSVWKRCLALHGIETRPLLDHSGATNASDLALIIDAMDLLYSGGVDRFCIVSSDPHFASLARRIRNEKMFVAVMGNRSAPKSLRKACSRFRLVDALPFPSWNLVQNAASDWRETVREAVRMSAADGDWIILSMLTQNINKIDPSFDTRAFCHSKMLTLVQSRPDEFEVSNYHAADRAADWHVRIRRDTRH